MSKDNYLWKFHWDCGRQGEIEGLFVATEDEVADLIGKEVYFGEVLGKHSEICGTVEKDEVVRIDLDGETVKKAMAALGSTWCGHNPLKYLQTAD